MPELVLQDVEYSWIEDSAAAKSEGADEDPSAAAAAEEERAAIAAYTLSRDPSRPEYDPSATLSAPYAPGLVASLSPPAYVFVVDVSAGSHTLEMIKSALLAALEALSPQVWVGLVTVSGRLGLYDLKCRTPCVHYAHIRSSLAASAKGAATLDDSPLNLNLASLMSLDNFLQKLEHCKENLATAIESLVSQAPRLDLQELERAAAASAAASAGSTRASPSPGEIDAEAGGAASPSPDERAPLLGASSNSSSNGHASKSPARVLPRVNPCGFGAALSALLSYFGSVADDGFELNVRLLAFLAHRPNWGLGALPDRSPQGDHQNQDDFDKFSFRPNEGPMACSGAGFGAGSAGDAPEAAAHFVSQRSCAEFYRDLGAAASARGICIDLYAAPCSTSSASSSAAGSSSSYMDLATLKFLSVMTGGNLIYYPPSSNGTEAMFSSASTTMASPSSSDGGGSAQGPECSLPQDLFRQLRCPQGFRCLLRLRFSPELCVTNIYGHLSPSAEGFEGLYTLGGCDARKTLAVDLDFQGSEGFRGGYTESNPVVQVAFTYIGVVAATDPVSGARVERVEHRLRILTRQLPLVHWHEGVGGGPMKSLTTSAATRASLKAASHLQSISELLAAAAPEVVLSLLVQQIIHVSLESGLVAARAALREWIVSFVVGYHQVFAPAALTAKAAGASSGEESKQDGGASSSSALTPDSLDLSFTQVPRLQFLCRFVCALLKSPLLREAPHLCSADRRAFLHSLFSSLEPDALVKAVYPTLSSYQLQTDPKVAIACNPSDPQCAAVSQDLARLSVGQRSSLVTLSLHHPVLYLTRFSLSGCGDSIFLLDDYFSLRVMYLQSFADSALGAWISLPPPPNSDLSKMIKRTKANAPYVTPRVVYTTEEGSSVHAVHASSGGSLRAKAESRAFLQLLLEDESSGGLSVSQGSFSYQRFLEELGKEVVERIQGEQD